MLSKKRICAPILRRSQVRWDGLTKKPAGCPLTTNRIRFALPDPSDNARDQDGTFIHSHPHGSGESAGGIRRGLDNFWTGRDQLAEWNRSFSPPASSGYSRYLL